MKAWEAWYSSYYRIVLPAGTAWRHDRSIAVMPFAKVSTVHRVRPPTDRCAALQSDQPEVKERFTAYQHRSRNEYDYEADSDISNDEDEDARDDLPQDESPVAPGVAETAKTLSVFDDLEVLSIRLAPFSVVLRFF